MKKLRYDKDVIAKVFVNQEPSSSSGRNDKKPIIEEAYAAYKSFVKQKFTDEMTALHS